MTRADLEQIRLLLDIPMGNQNRQTYIVDPEGNDQVRSQTSSSLKSHSSDVKEAERVIRQRLGLKGMLSSPLCHCCVVPVKVNVKKNTQILQSLLKINNYLLLARFGLHHPQPSSSDSTSPDRARGNGLRPRS